MQNLPDFSPHGFQIIRELGQNPAGGRVTYLAQTSQNNLVVLKQFQFAKGGTWAGMKAIERETQVLQDLKHPGIPRYLGSFETEDGFCLLQEYKDAQPLSTIRSFSPDDIKHIAVSLLEILVYLQDRIPPVFHRDIKPENVLVDSQLRVYLIDFGFARIGGDNLAMSSVAMGTFGFMAPEQTRNLQLTTASDLYGLGLTLVCVIAQLKSHEIGEYVDFANQLDQKAIESKLKGCSLRFIDWLNQMVAPDLKKRFPHAQTALDALQPLYVKRTPSVEFDRSLLEFQSTKLGEKLSQTVTIINKTPETTLEGYWEVTPHRNDPPHTPDDHEWITISPRTIQGNNVKCTVTIDTRKLRAESKGKRELIFHSNGSLPTRPLPLQIETAPRSVKPPVKRYVLETLFSAYVIANTIVMVAYPYEFWLVVMGVMLFIGCFSWGRHGCGGAMLALFIILLGVMFDNIGLMIGAVFMLWFVASVMGSTVTQHYQDLPQPDQSKAWMGFWLRYFLAILCGISWGLVLTGRLASEGLMAHLLIPATSGAALLYVSFNPIFQNYRQLATYRRQEQHLIEP